MDEKIIAPCKNYCKVESSLSTLYVPIHVPMARKKIVYDFL